MASNKSEKVEVAGSRTTKGVLAISGRAWPRLPLTDALVAGVGARLLATLAVSFAAVGWFSCELDARNARIEAVRHCESIARTLAASIETSLSRGDAAAARIMVSRASSLHALSACRVILPDATIIADADASKIATMTLPEQWPSPMADAALPADAAVVDDSIEVSVGLAIAGRGPALVQVAMPAPASGDPQHMAVAGAGCALALLGTWSAYRALRRRLRALALIRDALLDSDISTATAVQLRIDPAFGAEARSWNALLAQRDQMKAAIESRSDVEAIQSGRGREGDMTGAIDAMWQGVILIDERMMIRYANGAAAVMLGGDREKLAGSLLSDLIAEEQVLTPVQAMVSGNSRQRVSVEVKRAGGEGNAGGGVLRFGIRPVRREDFAAAMLVVEDVTQQRAADEARNSFVAQATHELRTPLTNIRLYLEQITEEGSENLPAAEKAKALNVISGEVRRLERIVGDMLSVSEIEAGALKLHKGDVRLDVLFRELQDDYEQQAREKHIDLVFELPPKLPVIQGDRDKVSMAIHNLVGNGLKYTPEGGKVCVRVEAGPRMLAVDVEDNGIGIKADEQDLIFDKFYRAKDSRVARITGTGLGLALAREVARLHGGDVLLRSELDKGSTFTLTLPLAA